MFANRDGVLCGSPEQPGAGVYVYAAGSIAAGILDLIWGEFEAAHQPIQAFGEHIVGVTLLAYLAGVWLVAGGIALLWRGTAPMGARALAIIYLLFAVFWLPRFYTAPHALGWRIPLLISLLVGVGQQLILAGAAGLLLAWQGARDMAALSRMALLVRWTFGLSSIVFGLAHLTAVPEVAGMIPQWMPLGGEFWAVLSGIAFVLAGIAIVSKILDVLAAQLLALMLFLFSVIVLAPAPLAHPQNHVAWGSNAYNLAAVGAVWIFARFLAVLRPVQASDKRPEMDRASSFQ